MATAELAVNAEEFVVGARCFCEGFYATIRYVGEVPPAKGLQGVGALQIEPSNVPVQVCGWEWSGMTALEGSTVEITRRLNTSAAGQQALCSTNGR